MYSDLKKLDLDAGSPVSENEIIKFEKELNINFGNEFKTYLKEFGCLDIDYLEFYGICGNNNSIPSAIHATKSKRDNIVEFSKELIVFFEAGDGSFHCVDSEDNVYICHYNECLKIGKTFKEFIYDKAKEL